MRKKAFVLMLLMATFMPWAAKAQETVTVFNGTATSSYIPMYGSFFDDYTKSECIIPATELTDMDGGTITAITFYAKTVGARSWANTNQKVFLKEVSSTTLGGSYSGMTDATIVFDGLLDMPTTSTNGYTITFSGGYTYNGGNLLIGVYNDDDGDYNNVSWYGVDNDLTSGVSAYGYNSNDLASISYKALSFLPKTTFTYTPAVGGCGRPSLNAPSDITSQSATISWTSDNGSFNVEYKKDSDSDWTRRATNYSGYSIDLTGLEANSSYQVRVQSVCGDNVVSNWATKNFETPCAAEETFPFYEHFNSLTTNGEIPECWNNDEGTTTNANYKWSYYSTGHEGKCVRFNSYYNSYNTNFLKTVPMNFPAGKTMQLRFWYKNPTGGDFSIYISTDGGTTYSTQLATGLTGQTDWKEQEIVLGDYIGQNNVVIVFKGTSNNGSGDAYIYLDDIYVEEAPSCPKQSNLTATSVSSSSVTLNWTLGTNDQDHWDFIITTDGTLVPNASTTPTVSNTDQKPYTHSGLSESTKYYAFVRARCSDSDPSAWSEVCSFTTTQIPVVVDAEHPFSDDFEDTNKWLFTNGDRPNQWCLGSAVNNGGSKSMYISNDNGASNAYSGGSSNFSVVYASKAFTLSQGTYTFAFDWRCKGYYDDEYLRVALVPSTTELTASTSAPSGFSGTALPSNWIALDGGSKLNWAGGTWVDTWTTVDNEISIPTAGNYNMVFVWYNRRYGSEYNPPAAIDNVSIAYLTCPKPTSFNPSNVEARTATLSWTENGTATNWVLQYATNEGFTTNLVEINDGFAIEGSSISYNITGLSGETTYYARVRSACGSNWSDVKSFTTLPTCQKPTSWQYTPSSNTAYSGSVQWEGSADGYEIAYKSGSSFDPSDATLEGVTRVTLGNVNSYTAEDLTPETRYYFYIRANCGETDGMSAWSTNTVAFTTLASCIAPSSLQTTATSSTITLSWTAGASDQNAWDIRYKKSNASEYTYIHLDNHPATNYTITGLDPITTYSVNVRAYCSETDQSKWGAGTNQSYDKSVETDCASLTLPYKYGFEENLSTASPYSTSKPFPKCWGYLNYQSGYPGSYTYYPYVYTATTSQPYAHGDNEENSTSGKVLYFYQTSSSTSEFAILPEISSEYEMNNIQIRFWAAVQSSRATLSVGVMTSPSNASSFSEIKSIEISNIYNSTSNEGFKEYTVSLENYEGNGRYIAIKSGTGSYAYFMVDDITVEEIPTCPVPQDVAVEYVSDYEVKLVWEDNGQDQWEVEYKKVEESDWISIPVSGNQCIISVLTGDNSLYEARVRTICSEESQSEWSNLIRFRCECGTIEINGYADLYESFDDSYGLPACWYKVPSYGGWIVNMNNPMVNSDANNIGAATTGIQVSNLTTYMVLPKMYIRSNKAKLSFDHLYGSSGSNVPSSVVVSYTGFTQENLDAASSIWEATSWPTSKTHVDIDLSGFLNESIYVAFKYEGMGLDGKIWYVDNVEVYAADKVFTTAGNWNEASNWLPTGVPTIDDNLRIKAAATIPNGCVAEAQYITLGGGSITIKDGGELKHLNEGVFATMEKEITGYGNATNGHWYFIAHPMTTRLNVSEDTDLETGTYELYAFDQTMTNQEWRNFNVASNNLSKLDQGTGYLYANQQGGTFSLSGILNPGASFTKEDLAFDDDAELKGWNLLGNPFACKAFFEDNRSFYIINSDGDAVNGIASTGAINPLEGVFIKTASEYDQVFFTTESQAEQGRLSVNVLRNRGQLTDNAIIRFSETGSLSKLTLNANATKVSIPQGDIEYGVVCSEGMGEQPLNFKAAENGTYTLCVTPEEVEMRYLHLIDNLTGADVDLLQSANYNFEARTTDYASRFKLIFATREESNTSTSSDTFAFINNENILVNVETQDRAIFQIIDMTGRVLNSTTWTDGVHTVSTSGMAPGVYMLRLTNGNDVKVQKMVVQ